MSDPKAGGQTRENREESEESEANWSQNLPALLDQIARVKTLVLYEGLPHQLWESIALEQEKKRARTLSRHGFPFYAAPVVVKKEDAPRLKSLCARSATYRRYGGPKKCGGYHPDWGLVFGSVEVLLCFGCSEARLYDPKRQVFADLNPTEVKQLQQILKGYRRHRPRTSHYRP